jgi:hypothetical protein
MAKSMHSKLQEKLALIEELLNPDKKLDSGTVLRLRAEKEKIEKKLTFTSH